MLLFISGSFRPKRVSYVLKRGLTSVSLLDLKGSLLLELLRIVSEAHHFLDVLLLGFDFLDSWLSLVGRFELFDPLVKLSLIKSLVGNEQELELLNILANLNLKVVVHGLGPSLKVDLVGFVSFNDVYPLVRSSWK
jgi:hypothetical protein